MRNLVGNTCASYGHVVAASRASGGGPSSSLDDFVNPIPVNSSTCGILVVKKMMVPPQGPTGTPCMFHADAPGPAELEGLVGPLTATGTPLPHDFTLRDTQSETMYVGYGTRYRVTAAVPLSWQLTDASCVDNKGLVVEADGVLRTIERFAAVSTPITSTASSSAVAV